MKQRLEGTMDFNDWKRIILQYTPFVFADSEDDNDLFIHENVDMLIEWFSVMQNVKEGINEVKYKDTHNEFEIFQSFSKVAGKKLKDLVVDHLEKVLHGLVFGAGKMKGFYDIQGRLPTKKDVVVIFYRGSDFFRSYMSGIVKDNTVLQTTISILPIMEKKDERDSVETSDGDMDKQQEKSSTKPESVPESPLPDPKQDKEEVRDDSEVSADGDESTTHTDGNG
jgi:hypothetical protein